MTGRTITIPHPPQRIVSLVPSQTELLFELGLEDEVCGITKFCIHPNEWFRNKKRVGGTKKVHLDVVESLRPDLIIANKEENTKEEIEALMQKYQVWVSDIKTVDDGLQMIKQVGAITGTAEKAKALADDIANGFGELSRPKRGKKVAYYIWKNPWMCAGNDTFIHDVIERCGWQNAIADSPRYPEIEPIMLQSLGVEIVLLSSEPYPFKEKHIEEIEALLPRVRVMLVDGEMFSWYGSRMKHALPYLKQMISAVAANQ